MVEWLTDALNSSSLSLAVFPFAFLLGFMGSLTSCCNMPLLGAIAGYSGTFAGVGNRSTVLRGAMSFMLGTVTAFAALGAVSAFIGRFAGASLGFYWKIIVGFVMVLFGLASLDLLPFSLMGSGLRQTKFSNLPGGSTFQGFLLGGAAAACSACCNPVLPVALAVTTLHGRILWGAAILATFSIGYGLPMTGGIVGLGLGFGNLGKALQKINPVIKTVSGLLLIAFGFYLLANL
jgi:cytochrome c biogenesis protein CcdA